MLDMASQVSFSSLSLMMILTSSYLGHEGVCIRSPCQFYGTFRGSSPRAQCQLFGGAGGPFENGEATQATNEQISKILDIPTTKSWGCCPSVFLCSLIHCIQPFHSKFHCQN